jgi:hypothetical protein
LRPLKNTNLGRWLKTTAPDIIQLVGHIIPDGGALEVLSMFLENRLTKQKDVVNMRLLIKELKIEQAREVSERWGLDMKSDSRLAKNIRPLVLASCLLFLFFVLILEGFQKLNFTLSAEWFELLRVLVFTVFGAYFTGRTVEKSIKKRRE